MRCQISVLIRHIQGDAVQQIPLFHVILRMRLDELALGLELDDGDGFVHF